MENWEEIIQPTLCSFKKDGSVVEGDDDARSVLACSPAGNWSGCWKLVRAREMLGQDPNKYVQSTVTKWDWLLDPPFLGGKGCPLPLNIKDMRPAAWDDGDEYVINRNQS